MIKILVVDDEETMRSTIAEMVEELGYCAIQASRAAQALAIIRDNPDIKALITDIVMPEMDGKELLRKLRAGTQSPKLPVILISGILKPPEVGEVLTMGPAYFVPKPIRLEHVREYLKKALT